MQTRGLKAPFALALYFFLFESSIPSTAMLSILFSQMIMVKASFGICSTPIAVSVSFDANSAFFSSPPKLCIGNDASPTTHFHL